MKKKEKLFYRYDSSSGNLWLRIYKVIEETKHGWWIFEKNLSSEQKYYISKISIEKYAYLTKREAQLEYLKKKIRGCDVLKQRLERVERERNYMEELLRC